MNKAHPTDRMWAVGRRLKFTETVGQNTRRTVGLIALDVSREMTGDGREKESKECHRREQGEDRRKGSL